MTKKGFSWDRNTWVKDYELIFNDFKTDILNSIAVTFPNYELTFILRSDASKDAWGGVLLQVTKGGTYECISLASKKFSDSAYKWDIQKKESYAIVASVKAMQYILTGKHFIIETDNKNITYMSSDVSNIVSRWRQYLQQFHTCLRFISGKFNTSDWLTRQYHLYNLYTNIVDNNPPSSSSSSLSTLTPTSPVIPDMNEFCDNVLYLLVRTSPAEEQVSTASDNIIFECDSTLSPLMNNPDNTVTLTVVDMFNSVHGGRHFHKGVARTYKELNVRYPGHTIPISVISDMILQCPTCQKVRINMTYNLPEEHHHLKPDYYRQRVGVDTLTVTPRDRYGNTCCIVVVEHFSKFVGIYPSKDHSADSLARALFVHYTRYGKFYDEIYSDPGSDLTSETSTKLNLWLGQRHIISLPERHESNGVEPTNKMILSYARTLIHDERIAGKWSDDTVIGLIQHQINAMVHSETGFCAFELKFGTLDKYFMILPDDTVMPDSTPAVLREFNADLKNIRDISHEWQLKLVAKRDNSTLTLNKYQPGDFVLFEYSVDNNRINKLDAKFLGPFIVLSHVCNEVTVRNLVTDVVSTFHCTRVKPFFGSPAEAKEAALRDADQYYIDQFLAYKGDPLIRSSILFYIRFADGFHHWKPWSKDLFDTQQYEQYCNSLPQLSPLVVLQKQALILQRTLNRAPITSVEPGNTVYMDLRALGAGLYEFFNLPLYEFTKYVVPLEFVSWQNPSRTKINCRVPWLNLTWSGRGAVDHFFVKSWGSYKEVSNDMTLINMEFIAKYNLIEILNNNN